MIEYLLNYGTVECCGWWRQAICQCVPPVSNWRQLVRLLMLDRVRDQSIKMGQLVELFKRGKNKARVSTVMLSLVCH